MNIVEPILFQCRLQPTVAAMCVPGGAIERISYGRLERLVRSIAFRGHGQGIRRGDVVALLIEDRILHAAFILGLTKLGAVTVSVQGPDLPKELKIDAAIGDRPYPFRNAGRTIVADSTWSADDTPPPDEPATASAGDHAARISLTSGTTGDAKACIFSHRLLLRRIARYNWAYGRKLTESGRILVDPNLSTAIGFLFWLHALSRGGTVFFRGDDAVETMQAIDLYKVQAMVAAPAALAEFVDIHEQIASLPPSLEVVITAGSLMSASLSQQVRSHLCSNLVCAYGATETHSIATAPSQIVASFPGAVGYVVPDATVEAVDEADRPLPPGEEGRLRIRIDVAADGYVGDPEATARAFRDGWFYPGDYGVLTADRLLIISGREKTILNLGGDKVNPERIERVLLAYPDIRQAAAFSIINPMGIEELHAAIVAAAIDEPALRAHCERQLPPGFVPRRFIPVDNIPVNEMGKIDRRKIAEVAAGL